MDRPVQDITPAPVPAPTPRESTQLSGAPAASNFLPAGISVWSLASLTLAALAALMASLTSVRWLTLAAAGLGLAAVGAASWARRGSRAAGDGAMLIFSAILCAGVVLVTALNSFRSVDAGPPETDPHAVLVVARERPLEGSRPAKDGECVDAATEGYIQDDLFIRVEEARAGRLPDEGTKQFLLVRFRVNQIHQDAPRAYERFVRGRTEPVLTDDTGQSYAFVVDRVRKEPTKFDLILNVDHYLVFELPPSAVQGLKLEVPASAWGQPGRRRFRIDHIEPEETIPPAAQQIALTKAVLRKPSHTPPDPALGRTLFAKNCMECHTLYGFGGKVGPDLTKSKRPAEQAARLRDLDFVLTSIIDPSAVIEKEFRPTLVTTTNGLVYNGILKKSDDASITLLVPSRLIVIPRSQIETMEESKVSLMPTELLKPFSEHEVRSLVTYVMGTSQGPMLATVENAPFFFFFNRDLSNWHCQGSQWEAGAGEITAASPQDGKPACAVSLVHLDADFHVTLRVRVGDQGTGAVLLRDARRPDAVGGPRIELAAGERPTLVLVEDGRNVRALKASAADSEIKIERWNKLEIIAADDRLRVRLNDQDALEIADPAPRPRRVIALEGSGSSGSPTRFRDLDLRVLAPK
jgi:putative heme-binding domain-containing protein